MKKLRPVFAAVTAILFYTITDILIWQRIFENNQMIQFADVYHTGWFTSLAGYGILGIILLWGAWKDCAYFLIALFVGAFSGLEDILYYLLDGKPIPEALPWLTNNPMIYHSSRFGLIFSVLFWIVFLAVVYFFFYEWKRPQKQPVNIQ